MDKSKIWIIIVVMSAALLGSVFVQVYWIQLSLRENEQKFDDNVFTALRQIAQKLDDDEASFYNTIPNLNAGIQLNQPSLSKWKEEGVITKPIVGDSTAIAPIGDLYKFSSTLLARRKLENIALAERIKLDDLDAYIENALHDAGIGIEYRYGVFEKAKNSFIILDGRHVFPETDAQMSQAPPDESLYNSKYEVNLFASELVKNPPGMLKIFFPLRSRFVWRNIYPFVMASVFFTSLILLCFSYTVYVIFRQKKISEIKTDFINNMTHEFKTPIATISLATDSILSPMILSNNDKVKRFIGVIKQENARMLSQVEKVLQMAQIDKKNMELKLSSVNLHDIVRDAVDHINLQVEKRGGMVSSVLEANDPIVEGDVTHISNMIHNLLDNANKYTVDTPEITVSTANHKNGVIVTVRDNGIGLSKEARKHVFEKFYRVPTGNLHDIKGFGLGLSYVKAMMNAHNGDVEVKSELGKGSSFTLYFPRSQAA
ncbi:MAG TPA: HAMP domain-containing sensor histidine kinase [Saprospiraceae bacterium]|nr:HAMP domain-containing histidine kinase [Saprospiraceae bacterium]MCB9271956.1 HAMP domain-containing histidine kinase [Lewinellaceae bacterium]HPG07635.1 HAMP domain-containing sensor histidine kinase [Saprospiraceae bacterium]HPR00711.1 HAMP domain-containing sensor histidine kinase [Saprospiraceae bacterium]HRV84903.1 HAMP domain-containing sensor histidine kinase [Saprospiraceae bacterium]